MSAGGAADARALHEWLIRQHHLQQQHMHYLTAMKQQQQQQQQRGVTSSSSGHHVTTSARLQAHLYDAPLHQQLQPPQPTHAGLVTSPEVGGLFPHDADVTSRLGAAWKNDGIRLSAGDGVDWGGLDVAVPGYASGLQHLLLAN